MEEDVDARLDWADYGGLRTEMGYSITADGILLIVESDENLGGLAEMLGGSVPREEEVPKEEHKVHEGAELNRLAVPGALRIFSGPEAEVEANGDQVSDVVGYGIGGGSCCNDNVVYYSQGSGLFSSDGGVL